MILNFIFSYLNAIVLAIWIVFLIIVAIRFFRPAWVKSISYWKFILIAIGLNIFYGLFVTWGQYYVWANGGIVTQTLLNSPLPKQVSFFEWARPLFENHLGYFLFYIWGRFWLYIFISFLISGILYFLFRVWKSYRGSFTEQGPELLLVLMLISGYPGILILIPLGFIFSILLFGFYYFKGDKVVNIEPAFIVATLFALFFPYVIYVINIILGYVTSLFPSFVFILVIK